MLAMLSVDVRNVTVVRANVCRVGAGDVSLRNAGVSASVVGVNKCRDV